MVYPSSASARVFDNPSLVSTICGFVKASRRRARRTLISLSRVNKLTSNIALDAIWNEIDNLRPFKTLYKLYCNQPKLAVPPPPPPPKPPKPPKLTKSERKQLKKQKEMIGWTDETTNGHLDAVVKEEDEFEETYFPTLVKSTAERACIAYTGYLRRIKELTGTLVAEQNSYGETHMKASWTITELAQLVPVLELLERSKQSQHGESGIVLFSCLRVLKLIGSNISTDQPLLDTLMSTTLRSLKVEEEAESEDNSSSGSSNDIYGQHILPFINKKRLPKLSILSIVGNTGMTFELIEPIHSRLKQLMHLELTFDTEECHEFLTKTALPNLRVLSLVVPDNLDQPELAQILKDITTLLNSNSLSSLHTFKLRDVGERWCEPMDVDFLSFFKAARGLKMIELRTREELKLTDELMEEIGKELGPNIKKLILSPSPNAFSSGRVPKATLLGLVKLISHCPNLMKLGVNINARKLPARTLVPRDTVISKTFEDLEIGRSAANPKHGKETGQQLDKWFPNLQGLKWNDPMEFVETRDGWDHYIHWHCAWKHARYELDLKTEYGDNDWNWENLTMDGMEDEMFYESGDAWTDDEPMV